jgi:hypothetical protein
VTGAYVCFGDEAGQNLRPPKARTWAPRGRTPVVRVPGKGPGKVSVAGLACCRPGARSRLFCKVRTCRGRKGERRSMSEAGYASLVTAARNQLHAAVILVWGNLNTHLSATMRAFTGAHPDWLTEAGCPPMPLTSADRPQSPPHESAGWPTAHSSATGGHPGPRSQISGRAKGEILRYVHHGQR